MTQTTQSAISLRIESRPDLQAIRRVHTLAFGRLAEPNLVEVLRRHWQLMISVVAEVETEVVGHVALTQVTPVPPAPGVRILGLGPVGVLPEYQRQGIGSRLVREAVAQAGADGWQAVAVIGEAHFYSRFGFVPAHPFGLQCEFRVPAEWFMVLELQPGALGGVQGIVRYLPEFSGF